MTRFDVISHEESIELLPWLVNHSLDESEREAVRAHAASCIVCRRELAELEALERSIHTMAVEVPAPDMRRINARIDAQLERESRAHNVLETVRSFFASPWRAAFVVQSLALIAIATFWLQAETGEPQFQTLTSAETLPAGNFLRVVFDPNLEPAVIDRLLVDAGLGVVAGPTERGVVTLRFADTAGELDRSAVTEALREDPRVLFLQPLAGGN